MTPRTLTSLIGRNLPKILQPKEPAPSIINEKTIADFTRVVEQPGILEGKPSLCCRRIERRRVEAFCRPTHEASACRPLVQALPRLLRRRRLRPCVLLGLPGLELLEQRVLVGIGRQLSGRAILFEEFVEPDARDRLASTAVGPLLGRREALPVLQRGRQRDLLPLRMEGRILEG